MKTSPTQRSLALLRSEGVACSVVERWNPYAKIRQDLFGIIDIVGLCDGYTLGVQTTTQAHAADRQAKMRESEHFERLKKAGWRLVTHGWAKRGGRGERKTWSCNVEEVS